MFHTFRQNNSGGEFDYDEAAGVSVNVIVEGDDLAEITSRARGIGLYFDGSGDCACCGNRWYEPWSRDDLDAEPMIYGRPVAEWDDKFRWITDGYETFIHYADGRVVGAHHSAVTA